MFLENASVVLCHSKKNVIDLIERGSNVIGKFIKKANYEDICNYKSVVFHGFVTTTRIYISSFNTGLISLSLATAKSCRQLTP